MISFQIFEVQTIQFLLIFSSDLQNDAWREGQGHIFCPFPTHNASFWRLALWSIDWYIYLNRTSKRGHNGEFKTDQNLFIFLYGRHPLRNNHKNLRCWD